MGRLPSRPLAPWAARLRARSQLLGLSDTEVARRAGLSQSRYANYLVGLREPSLDTLGVVCRVLGVTLDAIIQGGAAEGGPDPSETVPGVDAFPDAAAGMPSSRDADVPALGGPPPLSGLRRTLLGVVLALPEDQLPLALRLLRAMKPEGKPGARGAAMPAPDAPGVVRDVPAQPPPSPAEVTAPTDGGDFSRDIRPSRPSRRRLPRHP